jgi:UDP-N-acetylglucosamine acyltransferase
MKRRGYSAERIALIRQIYRLIYRQGLTLEAARAQIDALTGQVPEADADIALLQSFLSSSTRGIVR